MHNYYTTKCGTAAVTAAVAKKSYYYDWKFTKSTYQLELQCSRDILIVIWFKNSLIRFNQINQSNGNQKK